MTDILNFPLWSDDHTYRTTINLNRALPNPTTVTNQVAWDKSLENRVRLQVKRLCCEETYFCEGVKVRRTDCNSKQSYNVNNDRGEGKDYFKRYSLDGAVARVLELVAEREAYKVHK
jgi:hypothetical protein